MSRRRTTLSSLVAAPPGAPPRRDPSSRAVLPKRHPPLWSSGRPRPAGLGRAPGRGACAARTERGREVDDDLGAARPRPTAGRPRRSSRERSTPGRCRRPSGCHAPVRLGNRLAPGVRVDEALRLVRRLYRRPAPRDQIVERANIGALLRQRTDRLSGGQAQRVRFAIAIAGNPDVVFLDEPTSAMDVESRQRFWRMMRAFGDEGRTVLFATHHLTEADEIADRVVVLNHGKVVADGPGATLKAAVATRHSDSSPTSRTVQSSPISRASRRSTSAAPASRSTHWMPTPPSVIWSVVASRSVTSR